MIREETVTTQKWINDDGEEITMTHKKETCTPTPSGLLEALGAILGFAVVSSAILLMLAASINVSTKILPQPVVQGASK